ncbi:P-loop containing nucleoside triphosphate hydrolase protein [Pelagophyceae sp. CCMP2097]|nr:P-loop containing nucleoside triphosphate hydrolase protein [Pelagophyceae sp. CCMP2097]
MIIRGGSMAAGRGSSSDFVPKRRDEDEDEEPEVTKPRKAAVPQQRAPNAVRILSSSVVEGGCIAMSAAKLEELELFEGDVVRVRGRRGRETLAVAVVGDKPESLEDFVAAGDEEESWCALGRVARGNIRCREGDDVRVTAIPEGVKYAAAVHALPFDDSLIAAGLPLDVPAETLVALCLEPYFAAHPGHPLMAGDRIECPVVLPVADEEEEEEEEAEKLVGVEKAIAGAVVEFRVVDVDSTEAESDEDGVVVAAGEQCTFGVGGGALRRARDDERLDEICYEDIGGVTRAVATIRELVEAPLRRPEFFAAVGVAPPRGVLLHGAPGCGKTSIARALAEETGAHFFVINGAEILSKTAGEAEANLRRVFDEARKRAPSIIFFDELDAAAPRADSKDSGGQNADRAVATTLCSLLDELAFEHRDAAVVVVAATNRPNSIDAALRRYGRLDREVAVGVPDADQRLDVLRVRTRKMRLAADVRLEELARDTHGFVGADVAQLCLEAAYDCVRDSYALESADRAALLRGYTTKTALHALEVNMAHFRRALDRVNPSALRETAAAVPKATWGDVGGLVDVKRELEETVQYPVEHAAKFRRFGLPPSRGVLFYGPPGCGKTLLAQAVAHECGANFISIKGPELLTMWFGESEANVRELFEKARASAPCILFFDEIDAIAKARGSGSGGASEAGDRVINQILTEIDGVGARKDVFVIGATNRPEVLDAAITRPGRLDTMVYIPLPDEESRRSILNATLRKSPVHPDVDLDILARSTPGFSGADCAEICKRAARFAIRESVAAEVARGPDDPTVGVPNPMIMPRHFEMAMEIARRSVSDADLAKYEAYSKKAKAGGTNNAGASLSSLPGLASSRRCMIQKPA